MIMAGRYLLTPLFQIIARTGAREVMIAAALFVVLGSAFVMQLAGCPWPWVHSSPVSCWRNRLTDTNLEADIEPFRGLLLALFFIAVGLSMELQVILDTCS